MKRLSDNNIVNSRGPNDFRARWHNLHDTPLLLIYIKTSILFLTLFMILFRSTYSLPSTNPNCYDVALPYPASLLPRRPSPMPPSLNPSRATFPPYLVVASCHCLGRRHLSLCPLSLTITLFVVATTSSLASVSHYSALSLSPSLTYSPNCCCCRYSACYWQPLTLLALSLTLTLSANLSPNMNQLKLDLFKKNRVNEVLPAKPN